MRCHLYGEQFEADLRAAPPPPLSLKAIKIDPGHRGIDAQGVERLLVRTIASQLIDSLVQCLPVRGVLVCLFEDFPSSLEVWSELL